MLNAIERFMKQAIVDRNALVASSALVSGMHYIKSNPDIIRRWVNEVQEAVNSPHDMVQYHAVALLYQIRQHDRLAVSKVSRANKRGTQYASELTSFVVWNDSLLPSSRRPTCARTSRLVCSSAFRLLVCEKMSTVRTPSHSSSSCRRCFARRMRYVSIPVFMLSLTVDI
jgi:hypothetical protein